MMTLLLLACTPKGHPTHPETEPTASTTETGTPSPPTGALPAPRVLLPPSARVVGTADFQVGGYVAMVPAYGSDPGVLFFYSMSRYPPYDTQGWPDSFAISGDLSPGDHDLFEVWDGISGFHPLWPNAVVVAGDVNRDGHLDLWLGHELMLGPFLGRRLALDGTDRIAYIEGGTPEWPERWAGETAVAADFDADGDGELDVITQGQGGNRGFVHYGPFFGPIPSAHWGLADPATYSSLGEEQGCFDLEYAGVWLRDHAGPGRDAVAIGKDLSECAYDTYVWDPFVPRGTHLRYDQAIAVLANFPVSIFHVGVYDAGDVDTDGHPDLVYNVTDVVGLIVPGPLDGYTPWGDPYRPFPFVVRDGWIVRAVGDVNGDGAPEIFGKWTVPPDPDGTAEELPDTWVLLCSPFSDPIEISKGVLLSEVHGWGGSVLGKQWADLDGDGLADLIDDETDQAPYGLSIWYGKDLRVACDERRTPTE